MNIEQISGFELYPLTGKQNGIAQNKGELRVLPEILCIATFPPRECGIATYSADLIKALNEKFSYSFATSICPLESDFEKHTYTGYVKYKLNTDWPGDFFRLARNINHDDTIKMVLLQHEFGLFNKSEADFSRMLRMFNKPLIIAFHTVLPNPNRQLKELVQEMVATATFIIVMTHFSAEILTRDYSVAKEKIVVIPHGTHMVALADRALLKLKYNLSGYQVLSTFGLLSSGKSIETTLQALPAIIAQCPNVRFLVIGKTHPSVVKQEGEQYRAKLEKWVRHLNLEQHVVFINAFLELSELLEYLQLTDVYLFTSRDPNQAVSGTCAYAVGCGCPVISTPIPHALELLKDGAGVIVDFEQPQQLATAVIDMLNNEPLRNEISSRGLHKMASTCWENSAIAHALLFTKISAGGISLHYSAPVVHLRHIKAMTTATGIIQFANINHPDIASGYTLDDNARALIALCQHYMYSNNAEDLLYIDRFLDFILFCQQPDGSFLNYVNEQKEFTGQNNETNLSDANGRAIWALGYLLSLGNILPAGISAKADAALNSALGQVKAIHSTRAMAFVIKGLYYRNLANPGKKDLFLIRELAGRLLQMYRHEADQGWHWFESYLTYANGILPEAMLCAAQACDDEVFLEVARTSFGFLLNITFDEERMRVISNKNWFFRDRENTHLTAEGVKAGGEQPIDVAYTILALARFYDVFGSDTYLKKMGIAFSWFLGNNHLHQVVYNPCTGGCYDGLEEHAVNLNQGAESTISYLMARLTVEQFLPLKQKKLVISAPVY
ncbi:MAG: glycosyltransferase [Dinghuibacter sp.]|nr:glycosyltransferase [Dinghuibacter sp.]